MNPEPIEAHQIAPGVTLFTKDGRQIGNAIVRKQVRPSTVAIREYLNKTGEKLWLIETDFGNTARFTDTEINSQFELGFHSDHTTWWNDRLDTIKKTVEDHG